MMVSPKKGGRSLVVLLLVGCLVACSFLSGSSTTSNSLFVSADADVAGARTATPAAENGGSSSTGTSTHNTGVVDHALHIMFCASWGMAANFNKVRLFLEESFPELQGKITGSNYPPPPLYELLTNCLAIVQACTLGWIVVGGDKILKWVAGITVNPTAQHPKMYYTIQENGFQIAIVIFLVLPQLISRFMVTGAFEIYLNESTVIFSKLETGQFPKVHDLIVPLTQAGLIKR